MKQPYNSINSVAGRSSVGVIRWDAQAADLVGSMTRENRIKDIYYVMTKEKRYMSYPQFFNRLPWYAEISERGRELYARWKNEGGRITAPGPSKLSWEEYSKTAETQFDPGVKICGARRDIMLREVKYAADAGINYWVFLHYRNRENKFGGCLSMSAQRAAFLGLSLEERRGLKWCPLLYETHYTTEDENWLIEEMQKPGFMTVLDNRPLIYISIRGDSEDETRTLEMKSGIKNKANIAGLEPYFVTVDIEGSWAVPGQWGKVAENISSVRKVDAEAVSWYAYAPDMSGAPSYTSLDKGQRQKWSDFRKIFDNNNAADIQIIPHVTVGIDTRARSRGDLAAGESKWWSDAYWGNLASDATEKEIEDAVFAAFEFNYNNYNKNNPNLILMYAWNEYTEGGFSVGPQFNPDNPDKPNTTCVDGIKKAVDRAESEINWQTQTFEIRTVKYEPANQRLHFVIFDPNGGHAKLDNPMIPQMIADGGKVVEDFFPEPPDKNYKFNGWHYYIDRVCYAYNFDTPVTDNLVLVAQWDLNS